MKGNHVIQKRKKKFLVFMFFLKLDGTILGDTPSQRGQSHLIGKKVRSRDLGKSGQKGNRG